MELSELNRLLERLASFPKESEIVEFKENFHSKEEIGERISALSNSACLSKQPYAYLVFGITDENHDIVGTDFHSKQKMSNQTIRERFGIDEHNSAVASRIIKDAIEAHVIKENDPDNQSKKYKKYVPYWA